MKKETTIKLIREGGATLASWGTAAMVGTVCGTIIAKGGYKPFMKVCSIVGAVGLSCVTGEAAATGWRETVDAYVDVFEAFGAIKKEFEKTKEKGEEGKVSAEALS